MQTVNREELGQHKQTFYNGDAKSCHEGYYLSKRYAKQGILNYHIIDVRTVFEKGLEITNLDCWPPKCFVKYEDDHAVRFLDRQDMIDYYEKNYGTKVS
jgi:hypothetical protein